MASPHLPHYLRSNRKRVGLSQADVAFLLGRKNENQVSRYEHFARVPNLEQALAFEVIFKRSASELFNGLYQQIEREVAERARALAEKAPRGKANQRIAQRRQTLTNLAV